MVLIKPKPLTQTAFHCIAFDCFFSTFFTHNQTEPRVRQTVFAAINANLPKNLTATQCKNGRKIFRSQKFILFGKRVTQDYTAKRLRPFARRLANTRRPLAVVIRSRKPCLFFLLRLCGWNVLFIVVSFLYYLRWMVCACDTNCYVSIFAAAKLNIKIFNYQKSAR